MINALTFTLLEAGLSAGLSVGIGVCLARIWMGREIWQRDSIESLIVLPFFLPPLFVVLAVVRFYGNRGLGFDVFGLSGIVLAHMILNVPLAFYMVLQEWRRVPIETLEIAENLGAVGSLIERPVLSKSIPSAFGLIFLYASLSFTIVLTLGGGPASSTLELAIYQAIRFDFDLSKAFMLSFVQAVLGIFVFLFIRKNTEPPTANAHRLMRIAAPAGARKLFDICLLIIILTFLLLPVCLIMLSGLFSLGRLLATVNTTALSMAILMSFLCAFVFASAVVPFSLWLVWRKYASITWLVAAISPLVISTAFLLLLRIFMNPFDLGVPLVIMIQVIVLCPVFVHLWQGAVDSIAPEEIMCLENLTNSKWARVKLFYAPRLKAQYLRLSMLAIAIALGDLALYPLLAPPGFENMPMLIMSLMSSYRFAQATSLAVVVVLITGLLLYLGQKWAQKWELQHG